VAAVYNRFEYHKERRDALAAWAKLVAALVHPESVQRNVVALRA